MQIPKILFNYPKCSFNMFILERRRDGPLALTNDYDYLNTITFAAAAPTDFRELWAFH